MRQVMAFSREVEWLYFTILESGQPQPRMVFGPAEATAGLAETWCDKFSQDRKLFE
jgi:hypothetical protein